MSECCLGKKFHKNVKDIRHLDTTTNCLLFGAKDTYGLKGVNLTGLVCIHCCMACLRVLEIRSDLIRNKTISEDDERGNSDILLQFLPKDLIVFGEAMLEVNKSFKQAKLECDQCAANTWNRVPRYAPAPKGEPSTYVGNPV